MAAAYFPEDLVSLLQTGMLGRFQIVTYRVSVGGVDHCVLHLHKLWGDRMPYSISDNQLMQLLRHARSILLQCEETKLAALAAQAVVLTWSTTIPEDVMLYTVLLHRSLDKRMWHKEFRPVHCIMHSSTLAGLQQVGVLEYSATADGKYHALFMSSGREPIRSPVLPTPKAAARGAGGADDVLGTGAAATRTSRDEVGLRSRSMSPMLPPAT